jgi:AraC-like DNA-binding protein
MPLSPKDGSLSILIVRALVAGAGAHGIDSARLSEATGVAREQFEPRALADPDARVPGRVALALWHALPKITGREHFGLWLAELVGAAPLTAAAWFILSSRNLEEGLERAIRFQRLLHDQAQSELVKDGNEITYRHQIGDSSFRAPKDAIEFGFAQAVLLVRRASGKALTPARVYFQHTAPANLDAHRAIFGNNIVFGTATDELAFAYDVCQEALPSRDDALGELITAHARALLERLPTDATWTTRVRRSIADQLPRNLPSVEGVSRELALPKRTLQRRLADEGTSFEEILDDLRRNLAERYLGEQRVSVQEVAFLLGYSDLSAFHRAFQRWHGLSPMDYKSRRAPD